MRLLKGSIKARNYIPYSRISFQKNINYASYHQEIQDILEQKSSLLNKTITRENTENGKFNSILYLFKRKSDKKPYFKTLKDIPITKMIDDVRDSVVKKIQND